MLNFWLLVIRIVVMLLFCFVAVGHADVLLFAVGQFCCFDLLSIVSCCCTSVDVKMLLLVVDCSPMLLFWFAV